MTEAERLDLVRSVLTPLQALAEKATRGPWFKWLSETGGWTIQVPSGWLFRQSDKGTAADAALIVAAVNALPALTRALASEERNATTPQGDAGEQVVGMANRIGELTDEVAALRAERQALRDVLDFAAAAIGASPRR